MTDRASLATAIPQANAARRHGTRAPIETILERLYGHSERLAVYGSLAPGKANHHVIAHLSGIWSTGYVRGLLYAEGWGSTIGYPAIRLTATGERIPVHVLACAGLGDAWTAIDAFEGPDYCRVLAAVEMDDGMVTVANIYEAR